MKKTFVIFTILIFIITACRHENNNSKNMTHADMNNLDTMQSNLISLTGYWILICYTDIEKNTNEFNTTGKLYFNFKDDGKSGTIKGRTSANDLDGKYTLYENNKIKMDEFGGTNVLDRDRCGQKIKDNMRQVSSYTFNSDTLVILYDNDKKAMKFIKIKI